MVNYFFQIFLYNRQLQCVSFVTTTKKHVRNTFGSDTTPNLLYFVVGRQHFAGERQRQPTARVNIIRIMTIRYHKINDLRGTRTLGLMRRGRFT